MALSLSIVVVAYGMARELPRTLKSLAVPAQRDIEPDDYEVVLVDNGTPGGLDPSLARHFPGELRTHRLDAAPPSPAFAANQGIALARGDLIGLVIDGARMASPGLLATARLAGGLAARPIITSPAYHLGATTHMDAAAEGYDERVEDELLAAARWEEDGYELFTISTLAGSSGRGWFGPMGESSALFMRKKLWQELGGLDERFALPGGGLVNHDLYRRACASPGVQLVTLLGEGTFHQFHGGAATTRRFTWDEMHADYRAIRGLDYRPPENVPIYIGGVPVAALSHLERSAQLAIDRTARSSGRSRTR
ncbi:MAG: glycosyltransferase family 2 protein [Acidimicrobiia bacterium]